MTYPQLVLFRKNNKISDSVMEVALYLEHWWRQKGDCWNGNEKIASAIGRSVRTVQAALQKLSKLGFIDRFRDYSLRTRRVITRAGRSMLGMLSFMAPDPPKNRSLEPCISAPTNTVFCAHEPPISAPTNTVFCAHEPPISAPTAPALLICAIELREEEEEKKTELTPNSRVRESQNSSSSPPTAPKPQPPREKIDPALLALARSADERFPTYDLGKAILQARPSLDLDVLEAALDELARLDPTFWTARFLMKQAWGGYGGIYGRMLEQKQHGHAFRRVEPPGRKAFSRQDFLNGIPASFYEQDDDDDDDDA